MLLLINRTLPHNLASVVLPLSITLFVTDALKKWKYDSNGIKKYVEGSE